VGLIVGSRPFVGKHTVITIVLEAFVKILIDAKNVNVSKLTGPACSDRIQLLPDLSRRCKRMLGRLRALLSEWKKLRAWSEEQQVMSKTPSTDTAKNLIMPGDVRAIQVVSLVEEIGALGKGITFTTLSEKTGVEIDVLPPILKAAEMLGLVGNEGGDLSLTEEGLQFQGSSMDKVSILRDKLASIEPFRTAVELASGRGSTTAREVAENLAEHGVRWHFNPERNELAVRNLLIHWMIRAGLLSYDGKDGKFQAASSGTDQPGEGNRA
jgi:hypothetical protein